jgi:hypothetical protein
MRRRLHKRRQLCVADVLSLWPSATCAQRVTAVSEDAAYPLSRARTAGDFYSILNACIGLVEAARRAGINPAKPAAIASVRVAIISTPASTPVTS